MSWMTAEEVADRYRITVKGLLKQRTEQRAPGNLGKRVGKRVLWASEELDRFDGHEEDSFGAFHALILEVRGVNRRLDKLIAQGGSSYVVPAVGFTTTGEEIDDDGE